MSVEKRKFDSARLDEIEQNISDIASDIFQLPSEQLVEKAGETDDVSTPAVEQFDTDEDFVEDNDDTPEKAPSRFSRIKDALGKFAITRPFLMAQDGFERLDNLSKKKKESKEDETDWQRRRRRITRGVGIAATAAVTAGLVALYAKSGHDHGAAYAMTPYTGDIHPTGSGTDIIIGGHLDPTSRGVDNMLGGALQDGSKKVLIDYPAGMAPYPGDTMNWNDSIAIATDKTVGAALKSGDPNNVHIIGHSEGSQAAVNAANKLRDMGYTPELSITGSPDTGVTGFFDDPLVKTTSPLFDALGIDTTQNDLPAGTKVYGKPGDFWANSGGRPITTQVGQALGTAFGGTHGYSAGDLNNPGNTSFTGADGVEYITVKDDLSGYGHAAKANGLAWSPQAEAFVDAIAPEGEIGKASPTPDLNSVIQNGTNLAVDSINQALPDNLPKIPEAPVINPAPAPVENIVQAPAPVASAPAPLPVPVEVAPQINDAVNQVASQVEQAVGAGTPAGNAVNDIAKQANGLLGGLLPR